MSLPRYPEYKVSGVEWLGEVPLHWKVERLKYSADVQLSNIDKHTVEDEPPVLLCNYVDVYKNERINSSIDFMAATASPEQIRRLTLEVGDVIITKDSEDPKDIGVPALVSEVVPNLVCGYHLALLRPRAVKRGGYIYYLFKSRYVAAAFETEATGMTRYALGKYSIENLNVPLPLLEEQQAIAEFLDRETGKIDALIAEQQRLVELLAEKRQAVISHAVTKGLNPNARMKDSGIEWLGEVPEHWGISQSRRMFSVRSQPALASDKMLTASQKYGVLFQSDFVELEGRRVVEVIMGIENLKHVEPDDFIISMRSFQGGIEWCKLRGSTSFHYVMLKPIKWVYPHFFSYLFKSIAYIQALRATTDLIRDGQELRYSNFAQVGLPIVPIEEQKSIASFLDIEVAKFDTLTAEANRAIELLQERRSALISAAVTGKIKVTDIQ